MTRTGTRTFAAMAALGALVGAEWLKGRKGFYTMRDVINAI